MATLFDFSQAISKLNRERRFGDTLKFFKEGKNEFTPEQIGLNKYIVFEIISALIETNHYDDIFSFIEQYSVVLDPSNFSYLLKKFKDKPSVNWIVVNKFCDLVSVDSLNTECRTIEVERKGVKKPMELASNKEDWYAVKTKALFETQQYQDCFNLSKKALESFDKFHYSNEIWFARRIALSKKNLGNSTEALNELLLILRRKKEWFIQNEVAQIYKENGDNNKAFEFAISAINNFGDLEYKVGLIALIAELLDLKEEKELSFKHYSLSKLLRLNEGWNVPNSVISVLSNFSFEQIPIEKLSDLTKELKKYWNSFKIQEPTFKQPPSKLQIGKISKILNNDERGIDGFISYDVNKSIYFRLSSESEIKNLLKVGIDLEFKIIPEKDGKKERAVSLKIK